MNRWLRRAALAAAVLAGLGAAAFAVAMQLADRRMHRQVVVAARPVALRADAAAIERGRYLFRSRGCTDCHGADGAGRVFVDDGKGLKVKGPNISPGPGSVVAAYRAEDWDRAIRHGVGRGGRPLQVMPSVDYNRLTDDDLAALVAHLRHMPPAAGTAAQVELPPLVRALYGLGLVPDAAGRIDHARPPSAPVPEGVTPEHGRYVVQMCIGCHGEHFAGGRIPGSPPDWPRAADLTPGAGGAMTRYASAEAFAAMLRTGKRPDGSDVSPVMPFEALKALSATDMAAAHVYLRSLPPRAAGGR